MIDGLRKTGGTGHWSDAVFALSQKLSADYPGREVRTLDWGLQDDLYVLSNAHVHTRELFWRSTAEQSDRGVPWSEEIRRGGLFLLNGPKNRAFPAPSAGFLRALAEAHPSMQHVVFPQRSGDAYAELYDVAPNTIGLGPTIDSDMSIQEITAADSTFAGKTTGFHALEEGAWRWTKKDFSITFPATSRAVNMTVHLTVPDACIQKVGTMTLAIRLGDHALAPETFSKSGDYSVTRPLEPAWLSAGPNRFDFSLDKAISPDGRELGVIFLSATLDAK
jgi:hypothetical protein